MSLFLKNATYIDPFTLEFSKTCIKVDEGLEGRIGLIQNIPENKTDEIIDCTGKLVTKSFACGHHHIYSALARGMGTPKKSPVNFYEILKYVWWTLDKCLDKSSIEASALATAIACAKNGVTFIIDHHASPFFVKGSLSVIAEALEKAGLSHLLCYEISDRDGLDIAARGLEETEEYLTSRQGLIGLHASFTVGDDTLKKAVALAQKFNSGIHIHTAEDQYDQESCVKYYRKRVVQRLYDEGVLHFPKTILAHCIHLNDKEKKLVEASPAWVVQNTESNLNNNTGYFDSRGLGENIMLGTDGMHSDMLRSTKAAFLTGQGFDSIDPVNAYKRFRNVHEYIKTNDFKGDSENNLVVLDYDSPTEINTSNFCSHFIYGIESRHVQHVISKGKLIVKDRKITTLDEDDALSFAKKEAKKLWKRMQSLPLF